MHLRRASSTVCTPRRYYRLALLEQVTEARKLRARYSDVCGPPAKSPRPLEWLMCSVGVNLGAWFSKPALILPRMTYPVLCMELC